MNNDISSLKDYKSEEKGEEKRINKGYNKLQKINLIKLNTIFEMFKK